MRADCAALLESLAAIDTLMASATDLVAASESHSPLNKAGQLQVPFLSRNREDSATTVPNDIRSCRAGMRDC